MSDKRLRFALMLALLGGLVILLPGTRVVSGAPAAPHVYVRTDGNDSDCNGTADAAYPGSGTGLNCAFATVQKGAGSVSTGGTVHVAAGTYTETVAISQDLTLQGAGVDLTIVDGDASDTVLVCAGGYTVSISDVTIRNGHASYGGGIFLGGSDTLTLSNSAVLSNTADWGAGGIQSYGSLTIDDSTVADNVAGEVGGGGIYNTGNLTIGNSTIASNRVISNGGGGGIYHSDGTLTIFNSLFSDNTAAHEGGGIASWGGVLTMTNSTVSGNRANGASGSGGGVFADGAAELTNVTISGNTSNDAGGGIHNQGMMTLTNITVSGNIAAYGGGIDNSGTLTLTVLNSTITNNTVSPGSGGPGGIQNYAYVTFKNSILAYNQNVNCWNGEPHGGVLTSGGYNLDNGDSCGFSATGEINNTDPLLGPLADNGGPRAGAGSESVMLTHALLDNSPAIDTGTNGGCPSTDQRGVARPVDGDEDGTATCDIGAYEYRISRVYLPVVLNSS